MISLVLFFGKPGVTKIPAKIKKNLRPVMNNAMLTNTKDNMIKELV
jgi:hypothetical protein